MSSMTFQPPPPGVDGGQFTDGEYAFDRKQRELRRHRGRGSVCVVRSMNRHDAQQRDAWGTLDVRDLSMYWETRETLEEAY